MYEKVLTCLWAVAIVTALVIISFAAGFHRGQKRPVESGKAVSDTIYHTEVITVQNPPFLTSRLGALIRIPVHDTIREKDTLFVEVPREIKTYGDSTFRAVVSGYQPSLDFLELYAPVKTVTVKQPAPRWSFGITAGIGVQYGLLSRSIDIGPGIMVGVNYRIGK